MTAARPLMLLGVLAAGAILLATRVSRPEGDPLPVPATAKASAREAATLTRLVPAGLARGCRREQPHPTAEYPATARELVRIRCSLTRPLRGELTVARYPAADAIAERLQEWRDYLPEIRGVCVNGAGDTRWVDRDGHDRGALICGYTDDPDSRESISQLVWSGDRTRTVWVLTSQVHVEEVLRRWNQVVRPMNLRASIRERRLFALLDGVLRTGDCERSSRPLPLSVAEIICHPVRTPSGRRLGAGSFLVAWMDTAQRARMQFDTFASAFAEMALEGQERCGDAHLGMERAPSGALLCFPIRGVEYFAWTVRDRPLFFVATRAGFRTRKLVDAYENELGYIW